MKRTVQNETTVNITNGLDPKLDYVIFVSASTEAGESTNNYNTTLLAYGVDVFIGILTPLI